MFVRERTACSGCGTRAEEWDPTEGGSLAAYTAEPELCHGCRAVEIARETHQDAPAGLQIVLRRSRGEQ